MLTSGDPSQRLLPRGSFELWKETHEGKSERWLPETVDLLKRFSMLFVKIVIDRKEIVEKSNSELIALNNAKDQFVATVSHELRTPLNAIIGWTELSLSGELKSDRIPEALKIIQRNARSQNQLVNDLLDLSRVISGKMTLSVRNMRVSAVAESVVLSFLPAAEAKSIKIISHLDEYSDSIIGDPGRIQQVMWNLLSNAIKFSPKNARIFVTVRRNSSAVELEVTDQGIGIKPEDREMIFGRFQQVDSSISRKAGGLGLGLAICRHIVELHGGRIEALAGIGGEGTTLRVTLPIGPVSPEDAKPELPIDDGHAVTEEGSGNSQRLANQTILIVEDEPDAIDFLEILIRSNGAKTFKAANGKLALEVLEREGDRINVILSDVGMPEMDGYELMRSVRTSEIPGVKGITSIALTAFGRPQDRISALKAGFDSYISKPVMKEELLTVLQTAALNRKR